MNLYGIVGAGGFGREVIPIAQKMLEEQFSSFEFKLVFVDENRKQNFLNNYPVFTPEEFHADPSKQRFFNVAIAGAEARKKLVEQMTRRGAKPFQIKAFNSIELDQNEIGEGAILCPFTTITSNSKIGRYFHANLYSYVAHDCVIGDYVTFAPSVHCNGNVVIEDEAYLGTGVIIKQGRQGNPLVIGRGAVVGMGAVVTKNVPPYETVVGNPGRPLLRKAVLTEESK